MFLGFIFLILLTVQGYSLDSDESNENLEMPSQMDGRGTHFLDDDYNIIPSADSEVSPDISFENNLTRQNSVGPARAFDNSFEIKLRFQTPPQLHHNPIIAFKKAAEQGDKAQIPDQKFHIGDFTDPKTGFNPFLDLDVMNVEIITKLNRERQQFKNVDQPAVPFAAEKNVAFEKPSTPNSSSQNITDEWDLQIPPLDIAPTSSESMESSTLKPPSKNITDERDEQITQLDIVPSASTARYIDIRLLIACGVISFCGVFLTIGGLLVSCYLFGRATLLGLSN